MSDFKRLNNFFWIFFEQEKPFDCLDHLRLNWNDGFRVCFCNYFNEKGAFLFLDLFVLLCLQVNARRKKRGFFFFCGLIVCQIVTVSSSFLVSVWRHKYPAWKKRSLKTWSEKLSSPSSCVHVYYTEWLHTVNYVPCSLDYTVLLFFF